MNDLMTLGFYGPTNQWTHDHSAVLTKNGEIHTFLQLERLTRIKRDNRIADYLAFFLKQSGCDFQDLDKLQVGYANSFSLDSDRFFRISENNIMSSNCEVEFKHEGTDKLEETKVIGKIEKKSVEATIVPHEIAHIFSCIPFYGNFKDNSLLIHVDGAASISNASAWIYKNNKLQLLEYTTNFHHALLNFSYNDLVFDILKLERTKHKGMPGRLMGYSSYGKCNKGLLQWLRAKDFFLEYDKFPKKLFLNESKKKFSYNLDYIENKHRFSFNIAACIHKHFEKKILEFMEKHRLNTGAEFLYYSGGAALNIKLNREIVNSRKFKEVYIPPTADDSGVGLGAAFYLEWKNKNDPIIHNPFLNNFGLRKDKHNIKFSVDDVCKDISKGKILGIYTNNGEAGPRALGHRSIIANPCIKSMKQKVSEEIKGREWYRPLAPIILETELEDLFTNYVKSPIMYFMLYAFKVKDNKKNEIPAIVHKDGTTRAQVVKKGDKNLRLLVEILITLKDDYDIPCMINTSFNATGEPIVHSEKDALDTAKKIGLERVVINNEYLKLR